MPIVRVIPDGEPPSPQRNGDPNADESLPKRKSEQPATSTRETFKLSEEMRSPRGSILLRAHEFGLLPGLEPIGEGTVAFRTPHEEALRLLRWNEEFALRVQNAILRLTPLVAPTTWEQVEAHDSMAAIKSLALSIARQQMVDRMPGPAVPCGIPVELWLDTRVLSKVMHYWQQLELVYKEWWQANYRRIERQGNALLRLQKKRGLSSEESTRYIKGEKWRKRLPLHLAVVHNTAALRECGWLPTERDVRPLLNGFALHHVYEVEGAEMGHRFLSAAQRREMEQILVGAPGGDPAELAVAIFRLFARNGRLDAILKSAGQFTEIRAREVLDGILPGLTYDKSRRDRRPVDVQRATPELLDAHPRQDWEDQVNALAERDEGARAMQAVQELRDREVAGTPRRAILDLLIREQSLQGKLSDLAREIDCDESTLRYHWTDLQADLQRRVS